MSSQKIRSALGLLQDDADNENAWLDLQDALTSPDVDMSGQELVQLLEAARREHEARREWSAVANLLEYEISLLGGSPQEVVRQAELARILEDELLDDQRATNAYRRLLELRPNDPTATEALERSEDLRTRWRAVADSKVADAAAVEDPSIRSSMLSWAAEIMFRFGKSEVPVEELLTLLRKALELDPSNRRAGLLLERLLRQQGDWEEACKVLEVLAVESAAREERFAAWIRLARVVVHELHSEPRGVAAYERALELVPGYPEAMTFLSDFFSRHEKWEHLIALYEDQLHSGGVQPGQEFGIWLQIAMIQWRMLGRVDLAEPYFDKVRRAEPAHPGMLQFYRELCSQDQDPGRLMTVLTDAQRALPEGEEKAALAAELASLAETHEDVHKAIEQYKAVLRQEPDNDAARASLKRLYRQTEAWTSLADVLRHELERVPADDTARRLSVLREMAEVYRDRLKSDTALVNILGQILQLDDRDIDAVRELCRVFESLQRWRDLLVHQQKLAELSQDSDEKLALLQAAGKRWLEQFQNVQNATEVYERIFELDPSDAAARERLRELYTRRRAWPQLYALLEKEAESADEPQRLELYSEMAKLAAERLDRAADAIALYKRVLEIDPNAPGVIDALERQAEREKDYATVAEVLERRVSTAEDEATKVNLLQKLGTVYADRLKDPRQAASAWSRVLKLRPTHSRAMRVLRESYLQAEDYDAIAELYGGNDDWEGLAEVLSSAADRATDPTTKVQLSYRAADVYETRLHSPERAFRSYERILSVQPDDTRAAAALVPIYERDEKWSRLPALYEILLSHAQELDSKLELLTKLADVTGRRLSDKAAALAYAKRAYELAPGLDGALEMLEGYARAASSWEPFVSVIEARLRNEPDLPASEQRALLLRVAQVYAQELGRIDEAIATYRTLVERDPQDAEVLAVLDRQLRQAGRVEDLRWLFETRIANARPAEAVDLLLEWAGLEEEAFNGPQRAIELYRRALEIDPTDERTLTKLPRLLIAQGDAAGAAAVIESHRDQAQGPSRGELELSLAELYADKLERHDDALQACKRALELGADVLRATAVLDQLVEVERTRPLAAKALARVHSEQGNAKKEAAALSIVIDSTTEPAERLSLFSRLADVHEQRLGDAGRALDVVLRAVTEAPEELALWDRAKDLAVAATRPAELAQAYKSLLESDVRLAEQTEVELCQRAARLCREQIGDQDAAIPYLERVLARQPANDEAFRDLKEILMARERWDDLEALYSRAITGTTDAQRRIEFLAEVALICEDIIENPAKAIDYYERILEIEPVHQAASSSLEKLYAAEHQYDKLVALLERRLDRAEGEEVIDIKVRLGRLQLQQLNNPAAALPHLEDVLRLDPNQHEARSLAERILEVPELRTRTAEILEGVYETRDEIRDLVRVLDIRLEATTDDEQRRSLLRRIASLRDERLADDAAALDALAKLVPLDPMDGRARSRLIEIGRRIAAHERVAQVLTEAASASVEHDVRGAILMDVAAIYREQLNDVNRAEAVYRRVVDIDPNNPSLVLPAAHALEEIYAGLGNHAALVQMLRTDVKLEEDPERRADIYGRLGEICESILEDPAGAIEAWRARLDENPADNTALLALERLYEKVQAWRELVDVLRSRQDNAHDADERRVLMTRLAQTLTDKLGDTSEAILAWRAILDEYGPEPAVLRSLEALYDKAERWVDLAETLESHLAVAEEPSERLGILVRLGNVRREHQNDLTGALDAYRQALTIDPSHAPSRQALEQLLDVEEARREAAEILHPLYEADADHEKLLRAIQIQADTTVVPAERLELLQQAVRVAEGPLNDPERALAFATRGLREAAAGDDVKSWLETTERLASSTRRYGDLVVLLRDVLDQILDGEVQLQVTLRIADLARGELADRELARQYYVRAMEAGGDDRRPLVALEALYEEAGDAPALLDIIRRRVDVAETDEERKALLFRQAKLCGEVLEDRDAAIAVYESIVDIDMDPAAVQALEKLYMQAERPRDLIELYERQLESGVANKAELRVRIARVADAKLDDTLRAFDELAEALSEEAQHPAAIAELERLLKEAPDPQHRARAGEMLEPYYLSRADWKAVKATIEARLACSQDPDQRRELLRRLALMQEEQEEDFAAALETTAKLLHEDVTEKETWRQLESQARVAGAERRLAEIFAAELDQIESDEPATAELSRRTGELFASLGEVDRALVYYQRALAFEPESRELFDAIDSLLTKADRPAQRVQLYRDALDHRFEPADRLSILHTIADLERRALNQPEKAIDTYVAALDVEENDAVSLDALTELYREQSRFTELAELYLRRAESEPSLDKASGYRLALARLYRDQIHDFEAAIDQYEEIVQRQPTHRAAIADLEALAQNEEHKARVVDILMPLYEGADDWRKLIQLNAQRFDLTDDDLERVAILRDTARLWEERGGDQRRAFDALRAAFEVDPEDTEIRDHMQRLTESLNAWDELAEAYEAAIESAEAPVKRDLLQALALVHDERRDDPRRALLANQRLHELDEVDPEPLEKMDVLATLLADWPVVVQVLTKKAELLGGDDERAAAWRRLGEIKRDMLEDSAGAVSAFEQALELDPLSTWTIDSLMELYEQQDNAERLVELYQRRVELADESEAELKYALLLKAADRYENSIKDRSAAIDMLRQALDARPGDMPALRSLERLFRAEQQWAELHDNLRLQASITEDQAERIKLRSEFGKLLWTELSDPSAALEAFRMVLDEAPDNQEAIDSVRSIGQSTEDLRMEAADVLEPVLRATGNYDTLVEALEMRLQAQAEPLDRARTLRTMAEVLDGSLNKPAAALDALLRALSETSDDAQLHADIERLAQASDGYGKYADALEDRARKSFDADLARDLWSRLGRIAEDKIADDQRAVRAYSAALEQAGDSPELLEALDRLYTRLNDAQQLAEIIERRVSTEADPKKQADLYERLAVLQIESFGEKLQGLETLRMALDRAPDHERACAALERLTEDRDLFEEASGALEAVYSARQDYQRLAALYEKRVAHTATASDRVRVRLELSRMLEERAGDLQRAQRVLEQAVGDDPSDSETLERLETLAQRNSQWTEAARAFAAALDGAQDLDPLTGRDLYTRLSGWYRTRLADHASAEQAMRKALERDPENLDLLRSLEELQREPGRERDLIDTLRRRAVLEIDSDKRRELFRQAQTLAEAVVNDEQLSEQILRQLIELEDSYLWAYDQLIRLREKAQDWPEVVRLIMRRAELTASGPETLALKHRAAEVLRTHINDSERAREIYEGILDAEPTDDKAATALRQLYAEQGRHKDLSDLLERLIDISISVPERTALRLELAELYATRFDASAEAILVLRQVLEEEPGKTEAVVALSQLLQKSGRDEELAELLNTQIDLARERNDAAAELTFRVRLGEVYDSRLGNRDKAIETYQQVLEREPSHRGALEALGRLYESQGDMRQAAATLDKLLSQLSGDEAVELALRLATIYGKLKDDAGERRALEAGLAARRDAREVRDRLRKLYERTEAWAPVADLLAEDADQAGSDADKVKLLKQAADIHASKRQDMAAAAALLEKASAAAPDDRDLLLGLCDAYSASGRGKDAIAALEKVVESYAGKRVRELADIHHRLARAYVAEGNRERGLAELDQAFRINPGNLGILVDLGRLALDLNDLDRAQKTFRALLLQRLDARAPITKAEVFYYLGDISHRQGETQKAVQMLERAIENDAALQKAKDLLHQIKP